MSIYIGLPTGQSSLGSLADRSGLVPPVGAYWRPTDTHRPGSTDGTSATPGWLLPFDARSDGKWDRAPAAQGTPSLCAAGPYLRDGLLFPDARPGVTQ